MHRRLIRLLNGIVSAAEAVLLITVLLYAVYCLWDNQHVYMQASSVQNELLAFKPQEAEEEGPSFDELQAVNPDVCAWLTMDGTRIDFPVVQGSNNFEYLSLDVYGKFSLAGSIYLDSRNSRSWQDAYSLLHGHHLDQGRMFGDLDLYKQRDFFRDNRTGTLITPGGSWQLDVIAYLAVTSTDGVIFAPQRFLTDATGVYEYIRQKAVYLHEDTLTLAMAENAPLLSLATCSSEASEARTIILCRMTAMNTEGEVAE